MTTSIETRALAKVLTSIRAFGVETPEAVTVASEHAKALQLAVAKAQMGGDSIAALARKIAKREVDHEDAAPFVEHIAEETRKATLQKAAEMAKDEVAWEILSHRDALLAAIEEKMVTPALNVLVKAAEVTEDGDTLQGLLADGNTKAATALAAAYKEKTLEALLVADTARQHLLGFIRNDMAPPRFEWIAGRTLAEMIGRGDDLTPDQRRTRAVSLILSALRSGEDFAPFVVYSPEETHRSLIAEEMGTLDEDTVQKFRSDIPITMYGPPLGAVPSGRISF